MNYKLVNSKIEENFAESLLRERQVQDYSSFLNPTEGNLLEPLRLDNIDIGANLLIQTLKNEGHIVFIVDCDVDGYTSSAILWLYIKDIFPNANLSYRMHSGKQHGLEDMIDRLEKEDCIDLILIPDAGSNDLVYHERLRAIGVPVIVLDHHDTNIASEDAVVINNQLSENYFNKDLTGAGVVWQFCRYLDKKLEVNHSFKYMDLAALGLVSDMANVLSLENRYIIRTGLRNVTNFFFRTLTVKQSYSLGGKTSPISFAFYITPLINALIRVGSEEEKEKLFLAFLEGERILPSTKRGEKGMEENLATQVARDCTNARNRQNRIKEKAVELLQGKIAKKDLLSNKILFIRLDDDDDFPAVLNGLVAMQLAAKYKRPTIVARLNTQGYVRGSIRGLNESELKDFKAFLNKSGFFEYCEGHPNAAGCSIKNDDISKFHEYANKELKDYNFNEDCHEVNFVFESNEISSDLIMDLDEISDTYGQMNNEPLVVVNNITVMKKKIEVVGAHKDTVRILNNDILYMIFKAQDFIDTIENMEESSFSLTVLGVPNVNIYGNSVTPQIMVKKWEVKPITIFDF